MALYTTTCCCVLLIAILLVSYAYGDLSSSTSAPNYDGQGYKTVACNLAENMTFDLCKSSFGNITYFPNFVGHETQLEAIAGFNDFQPFLHIQCSPNLLEEFLCLVYFPRCLPQLTAALFPCRDYCQRVRDDCRGAFRSAGTAWPDSLDCEKKFAPVNSRNILCVSFQAVKSEKDEVPVSDDEDLSTIAAPPIDPSECCQPRIDDLICREMPYTTVIYPNLLGHSNQSHALLELHKYSVFMSMGGPCSDLLRSFMCVAYQPPCKIIEDVAVPIPPCQALCELVLSESCLAAVARFKMEFPATLTDCSIYPKQSDLYPTCFMPGAKYDPLIYWQPPPPLSDPGFFWWCEDSGCVAVQHFKCHSLGFWATTFPNLLGHESMAEAMAEMDRLAPLFNSGCSEELQVFMCFGFFLISVSDNAFSKMPCQNVCQRVWNSCRHTAEELLEKRPRVMTCRLYPVEDCDSQMSKPNKPVTIVQADRANLSHAFIEFETANSDVQLENVSPWQIRRDYHDELHLAKSQQIYVELEWLHGYHVVFWPRNTEGIGPPAAAWIPPNVDGPYPDHCERNDVMLCSNLGYNMTMHSERYWNWNPPDELLTGWQNIFTEDSLDSGEGCLPHLHELICGIMVHSCTHRQNSRISPCLEFCQRVRSECSSRDYGHLAWLIDTLPCDDLLRVGQGTCIAGPEAGRFESIQRNLFQYEDESVRVYCMLTDGAPSSSQPEFYGPDGKLLPVTSPKDRSSGRVVTQLSARMLVLQFDKVPLKDAGIYSCKATGGSTSSTVDIKPLVRCMPAYNHTLCTPFSRTGYVQSPNALGHTYQYQAEVSSYHFLPLLNTHCSPDLLELVCALYAPECLASLDYRHLRMQSATLPSQGLCRRVRSACAETADMIGFDWPSEIRCDLMEPGETDEPPPKGHVGPKTKDCIKLRRYDITDHGVECLFYGWVDVQGQGAANDYCRVVSVGQFKMLSCALAGTQGESQYNYNSSNSDNWLDLGHTDMWYMKDEDGDGRDDYCRCVGVPPDTHISCLRAGREGFDAEEFNVQVDGDCQYVKMNKFFGP